MGRISESLKHALNLFTNDPDVYRGPPLGTGMPSSVEGFSRSPSSSAARISSERSILNSIISTMAVDVAAIDFRHASVDENGGYLETEKDSGLQYCLTQEANLDQTPRHFFRDVAWTMLTENHAAIVPVETTGSDPIMSDGYDVRNMRVGVVTQWYPRHVRVMVYNDRKDKGLFEEITLPKRIVAIVENPFKRIMNEPNSILQRIIRKLSLLDVTDEKNHNGKLDLIIQLPYTVRTDVRREEADRRRRDIEFQLASGKYGIAYADSTEKITQLNRAVENNLWEEIEGLKKMLFEQLGITAGVMDGSADENTMTNYMVRTVEPIVKAIAEEMQRKFISKTARSQGQRILFFRDPFKLIPVTRLAEIFDVMSRNEIASPNELRASIGWTPSKDPEADKLKNSNMPPPKDGSDSPSPEPDTSSDEDGSESFTSKQMANDDQLKQLVQKATKVGSK